MVGAIDKLEKARGRTTQFVVFVTVLFLLVSWVLYQFAFSSHLTHHLLIATGERSHNLFELNRSVTLFYEDSSPSPKASGARDRLLDSLIDGIALERELVSESQETLDDLRSSFIVSYMLDEEELAFADRLQHDAVDVFEGLISIIERSDSLTEEDRKFVASINTAVSGTFDSLQVSLTELAELAEILTGRSVPNLSLFLVLSISSVWLMYALYLRPLVGSIIDKSMDMSALTSNIPIRVWRLNRRGDVEFENSKCSVGQNIYDQSDDMSPEVKQVVSKIREQTKRAFLTGKQVSRFELKTADGGARYFICSEEFLPATNIKGRRILVMHQDVTDLTLLEEELEVRRKLYLIGALAASVSHDFNNILSVLSGATELIEDGNHDPQLFLTVRNSISAGHRVTQRLLSLRGADGLLNEVFDIVELAEEVSKDIHTSYPDKISIEFRSEVEKAMVKCDRDILRVAIFNLAQNSKLAFDAEGGAVVLSLSLDRSSLDTGYDTVMVTFSDNGCGMSDYALENCRQPFFTTRPEAGGTGLGLSSIEEFLKNSDASMEISSELGRGTSVTMRFPLVEPVEDPIAKVPCELATSRDSLRVLVVDDDAALLGVITRLIEQLGHSATSVSDGRAAADRLLNDPPFDILLTDMVLHDTISGADIIREMIATSPCTKPIVMTGYTNVDLQRFFQEIGFEFPVLKKPVFKSDLAKAIALKAGR